MVLLMHAACDVLWCGDACETPQPLLLLLQVNWVVAVVSALTPLSSACDADAVDAAWLC